MSFESGQIVGVNYRIIRPLGEGGMATVYEVEHVKLGVHYALKTFTLQEGHVELFRKRFAAEGKILARLSHPNLVRVIDLDIDERTSTLYYVMDLVLYEDGETHTLADIEPGSVDEEQVLGWFRQLCSALAYYQGAFKLYARSGEYDLAAEALDGMKRDVKDVPSEVIIELAGEEMRFVADEKAPRLLALIEEAKRTASVEREKPQVVKGNNGFSDGKEKIGNYTWSYRVKNGEATIMAEEKDKDGKINSVCAISPKPTGVVEIPATLGGAKVTRIGGGAFTRCGDLSEVVIPSGVTSIEGGAFMNSSLKSAKIPEGVTTIGHGAFAWIGGLKSVAIPSSVTNIGGVAFISSSELESFHVAADNPAYSSRNGMLCTKDGSTLLAGINGEVVIPDGVTGIGGNAFHRCGRLKSVTVSASVTNIHSQAFFGCGGLTSVTMLGERPKVADNAFEGCDKLKSIHVPANAKSWAGLKEWQGIPLVFDAK